MVTDTGAGTLKEGCHVKLDDGPGVLGRHEWDPQQLSIGFISHGGVRIAGQPKSGRSKIARTASKGEQFILLASRAEVVGHRRPDRHHRHALRGA